MSASPACKENGQREEDHRPAKGPHPDENLHLVVDESSELSQKTPSVLCGLSLRLAKPGEVAYVSRLVEVPSDWVRAFGICRFGSYPPLDICIGEKFEVE